MVQKQAEGPKMRAAEAGAACVPTYWRILSNKTEATYYSLATACGLKLAHYPKRRKSHLQLVEKMAKFARKH